MAIVSVQKEIPLTDNLSSEYIENELAKFGIEPLRWAITDVLPDRYIVSVSYNKKPLRGVQKA
jgi:hypothetical protein